MSTTFDRRSNDDPAEALADALLVTVGGNVDLAIERATRDSATNPLADAARQVLKGRLDRKDWLREVGL